MNKKTILTISVIILVLCFGGYYFLNKNTTNTASTTNGTSLNSNTKSIIKTLSKKDFEEKYLVMKYGGAQIIDIRTAEEYANGHYEGSKMIDFYASDFKNKLNLLDKSIPYFIYCRSGNRSGQALGIMRKLGFKQVYDLAGGFSNAQDILTVVR